MDTYQDKGTVDDADYIVVWKFMPEGWAKGISDQEAPGTMPYFVDGEALKMLHAKDPVELTPYGLLCGILLSWFEDGFYGLQPDRVRAFIKDLLEDMRRYFRADSLEDMLLDVAANMRDKHGSLPASRMLTASQNILPVSAKIRCDLIQDVWLILEEKEHDQVDRQSAYAFIARVYQGINFEALDGGPQESIEYINLVCLSLLGNAEQRDRLLWQRTSKRVQNPVLRERLLHLIKDEHPDFENYRIWS